MKKPFECSNHLTLNAFLCIEKLWKIKSKYGSFLKYKQRVENLVGKVENKLR